MKATLSNGKLILEIDFDQQGTPSKATGKSLIHASTRGNIPTSVTVNGKPLIVSVNAYTPNK